MRNLALLTIIFALITACTSNIKKEAGAEEAGLEVIRKGSVIKVKPEKLEFYKSLHANPWESVNAKLKECNIQNYSIYYRDGYLFSYLEYTGINWEEDMAKMAADSATQAWWKLTDPCQEPVGSAGENVWWADLEEVYHLD